MQLLSGTSYKYVLEPEIQPPEDVVIVTMTPFKYLSWKSGTIAMLFGPDCVKVFKRLNEFSKKFKQLKWKVGAIFCPIVSEVVTPSLDFVVVYGNHPLKWGEKRSVLEGVPSVDQCFTEDYPIKHWSFYRDDGSQKNPTVPSHEEWTVGIISKEFYKVFPLESRKYKVGDGPLFIENFIEGFPVDCEEDENRFLVEK